MGPIINGSCIIIHRVLVSVLTSLMSSWRMPLKLSRLLIMPLSTDAISSESSEPSQGFLITRIPYYRASYGTTKYCSFFLKGIQCTKQVGVALCN